MCRLDKLPPELHYIVDSHLDRKDAFALSRTSSYLWHLYRYRVWDALYVTLGEADTHYEVGSGYATPAKKPEYQDPRPLAFRLGDMSVVFRQFTKFVKALKEGELDDMLLGVQKLQFFDTERGISPDEFNIVNEMLDLLAPMLKSLRSLHVNRSYRTGSTNQPDSTSLNLFAEKLEGKCEITVNFELYHGEGDIFFPAKDTTLFKHIKLLNGTTGNTMQVLRHFWDTPIGAGLVDFNVLFANQNAGREHTAAFRKWTQNSNQIDMLSVSALNAFDMPFWIPNTVRQLKICDHVDAPKLTRPVEIPSVKCFRMCFDVDTTGEIFRMLRFPNCTTLTIDPTEVDDPYEVGENVRACIKHSPDISTLVLSMACREILEGFIDSEFGKGIQLLYINSGFNANHMESIDVYAMLTRFFPSFEEISLQLFGIVYKGNAKEIWKSGDPAAALRRLVLAHHVDPDQSDRRA